MFRGTIFSLLFDEPLQPAKLRMFLVHLNVDYVVTGFVYLVLTMPGHNPSMPSSCRAAMLCVAYLSNYRLDLQAIWWPKYL